MARRQDHSRKELQDLILNVSWTIVGKEGFAGLTARRLAGEIGYAPGTIYNLFQSMDDLYMQINARTLDLLYETLQDSVCNNPAKPPLWNLKKMAAQYQKFSDDYHLHWLMLFSYSLPKKMTSRKWYQEKISRLFDPLESMMASFFSSRQGRKKEMAARLLWSSVHGLFFLQATEKMTMMTTDQSLEKMVNYMIETFIAGLESE